MQGPWVQEQDAGTASPGGDCAMLNSLFYLLGNFNCFVCKMGIISPVFLHRDILVIKMDNAL